MGESKVSEPAPSMDIDARYGQNYYGGAREGYDAYLDKKAAMSKTGFETAVGHGGCYIWKAGKARKPHFKQAGHGCLKGDYKSHGQLRDSCSCYKKCIEED